MNVWDQPHPLNTSVYEVSDLPVWGWVVLEGDTQTSAICSKTVFLLMVKEKYEIRCPMLVCGTTVKPCIWFLIMALIRREYSKLVEAKFLKLFLVAFLTGAAWELRATSAGIACTCAGCTLSPGVVFLCADSHWLSFAPSWSKDWWLPDETRRK